VFFDFDGVLVDSDPIWWSTIKQVVDEGGLLSENLTYRPSGLPLEEALRRSASSCRADPQLLALTANKVRKRAEPIIAAQPLESGTRDAIISLTEMGIALGIVSSSNTVLLQRFLEHNGIDPNIRVVVGGDRVDKGKPAPDGYLLAVREANVNPAQACAVEDSKVGLLAAALAGIWGIRFLRTGSENEEPAAGETAVRSIAEVAVLVGSSGLGRGS
jgi:HAD superfamily hydrolase (TIGR01509 family)